LLWYSIVLKNSNFIDARKDFKFMFCENCGSELDNNAAVCTNCGAPVNSSGSAAQSTYQQSGQKYCKNCGASMESSAAVCTSCGFAFGTGNNYCQNCGTSVQQGQAVCINCGAALSNQMAANMNPNAKSKLVAGLLGIFLGSLGIHNFYLGKIKFAVIQLCITLISCGTLAIVSEIWGLVEGIFYLSGKEGYTTDGKGNPLKD
jgi:TM2 domain-containing membrane protein YozV